MDISEVCLKQRIFDYIYLLGIAGLIVVLDQWTKSIVRNNLQLGESWAPWDWLMPYARIVHWKNTGAAFGMLPGMGTVFTILPIIVIIVIIFYFPQVPKHEWYLRLAMAMQMGGAAGNLVDRLARGHVTDFVSVGRFAVFNVADASISVGVAVLLVGIWIAERRMKQEAEKTGSTNQPAAVVEEAESD